MTNFVLTGLPNFIVVGDPRQVSGAWPGGGPHYFDSAFAEVLSLLDASSDRDELMDRIAYSERGDRAMRHVLDRFGFARRPDTFGELYGLLDYCDRLTALAGFGVVPPDELHAWQTRSFLLMPSQEHPHVRAVEFFCRGDLEGLKAWHSEPDALLHLGRAYRQVR